MPVLIVVNNVNEWPFQIPGVAVVDANGKVEYRDAVIARDNGSLVELSSGAQPGDRGARD